MRPLGANFCVFQDERNNKGVAVAYVDRETKNDVTVTLPFSNVIVEDIMGNVQPLKGNKLVLSKSGRPVFIYTLNKTPGKILVQRLTPLDRKNAGFVSSGGASFRLPAIWEGTKNDSSNGNPAVVSGKPVWRLSQISPPEPTKPQNYRPLVWRNGWWKAPADDSGDQPKAEMKENGIRIEFRASSGEPPLERIAGFSFIAPRSGTYNLSGNVELKLWDGDLPVLLQVLHKTATGATEVASIPLQRDGCVELSASTKLNAGDELVIVPRPQGSHVGGDITLRDLEVWLGTSSATVYTLPQTWEGTQTGTAAGNPLRVNGKGIWRIDQVWPDDPTIAGNYAPLSWNGTDWMTAKNAFGGQPSARITRGAFKVAVRGSWTGQEGQRIAGLVFMAPRTGRYRVTAQAKSQPWEGGAPTYKLGIFRASK